MVNELDSSDWRMFTLHLADLAVIMFFIPSIEHLRRDFP